MKRRIFWSILLTSFIVLTAASAVVLATVYREFEQERKEEIMTEARYIAAAYAGNSDYLQTAGQSGKNRLTLVDASGAVIFDSFAEASELGNHSDRPEIEEALISGSGSAERISDTLSANTFYYALRLEDGCVLRVAATMKSIFEVVDNTALYIELTMLMAFIMAVVAAKLLTKRIVAPINRIDPQEPWNSPDYEELAPLLASMKRQNKLIAEQITELSVQRREFDEITDSMNEAIVIFAADRRVLSANRSARRLFGESRPEGKTYLELCRDEAYIRTTEAAFCGRTGEERFERDGRIYRLSVAPTENAAENHAAVLLAVDITEAERAEQLRREFSANVSHELKTPLTSIMGCAEIMTNGVAKQEDFPRFAGQIHAEAERLLALINDIIKLSRLDEGEMKDQFERTDLHDIAQEVLSELADKASTANVAMHLAGGTAEITGIRNILHEVVFNLCDNAVIYNRAGGSVTVQTGYEDGRAVLTVEDTGIGIAPEHRDRIFERFYRVDKSRSKESGGTGLGLSIVKHGAAVHGASINLTSTPDKGTCIKIIF